VERWLGKILFPDFGSPFPVKRGLTLFLHPADYIEYLLLKGEDYEALTLDFLKINLNQGDSAAFAGVNFGLHVTYASKLVGSKGQVVGIEPQPRSCTRAWQNIQLNQCAGNITLISGGLGRERQILRFSEAPGDNTGTASFLSPSDFKPFAAWIEPLPEVFRQLNLSSPPKVFLLDVEGFELEVLLGLKTDWLIPVLIIEINKELMAQNKMSETSIYDRLTELGYECRTLFGEPARTGDSLPDNNVVAFQPGTITPKWLNKTS